MGVCESSKENKSQKTKNGVSSSSFGDYSTVANSKENEKKKYSLKNEYILPENLAKRDDINKYYNITQKVLGEGASGVVCIGEKNGKQYAIKKYQKIK